jgi:redox-sensitive bicupin YhaK (pirin superfamily)
MQLYRPLPIESRTMATDGDTPTPARKETFGDFALGPRNGRYGRGDVQCMTAAGGILHKEFHSVAFTRNGGTREMVQLWINLPAEHKNAEPSYQTLLDRDIPAVTEALAAGGNEARRVFAAVMGMKKIDVNAIKAARRG